VSVRGYAGGLARAAHLDVVTMTWQRIPGRIRGPLPVLGLTALAATYPFYVANLPTNIPLILTLPPLHDTVTILVFVVMAVGLNVVVGYAGLLDLGYVAFYALGAYSMGWFGSEFFAKLNVHVLVSPVARQLPGVHLNFVLILIASVIVCAVAGVIIGLPTLRLRGDYIAIVTLAFG